MAMQLRTQAGPWTGGITDTSAVIRASVLKEVNSARAIVAESADLAVNPMAHPASNLWADPERTYRHKVATFQVTGLKPATAYFVQLELDGERDRALPCRFRTAPAIGSNASFSFACGSCARPFIFKDKTEAYEALAAMPDLLFFLHLGDMHYKNIDDESLVPRLEAYDDTLRRDHVGDLFRQLPLAYCWDDHDFLGNNAEGGDPDYAVARRFARDAYQIYVPHYPLELPTDGISQSFQIGRVLFLLTDTRYSRSPRNLSGTSGKTMLGTNQKVWLKNRLLAGKELDLIVWANSVPWIGKDEPGEDYWAGYAHERQELAEFVVVKDIRNICMVSGDAHMVAIDDGTNSGYASGGRGGFPVFQAAALESPESEKGGPYSIGNQDGTPGPGVAGRRQFGVCEVIYDPGSPVPRVKWTAYRAEKKTARPLPLLTFEFRGGQTFAGF
jgi:phosphodiesterase/alkaline phosphatase D-like protein